MSPWLTFCLFARSQVNKKNIEVNMIRKSIIFCVFVLLLVSVFPPKTVYADVAPPESPPGTNLLPGNETTQVRMAAETVILTISKKPDDPYKAIAKTEAVFTMRNLGTAEENMQVRFPLSFFNGSSNGYGDFPEIPSIAVKINGQDAPTRREIQPFVNTENGYKERAEIPWAVFDVTFPPEQDVKIEVTYTVSGFGHFPYQNFKYILETGAGWNGTIGTADVIVRFPYEVNQKNVWTQEVFGYNSPTQGGVMSGNEVRWHFDDLEPTSENNIEIIAVTPKVWESVLNETDTVTKNPNDGEAWGRLGLVYKQILSQSHGELRGDPAGDEMFALSKSAYEKCLALLPNDPLWHYGYAELLWSYYYSYDLYFAGKPDTEGILPRILSELETALKIDPNNQQAQDLLRWISDSVPGAVLVDGDTFILLGLTATPIPPTPWAEIETPTFVPAVTVSSPTYAMGVNTPEPVSAPSSVCGSAFLLPALFGVVLIFSKRKSG